MKPVAGAVILVRHAHAEWPAYTGRDFDRPLTPRGFEDAAATARDILAAGYQPDLILASPALRTTQTARIIAAEVAPSAPIRFMDDLYNAAVDTLDEALREAAAGRRLTLLVAHNPGISELARRLTGDAQRAFFAPAQWQFISA